MRIPRPKCITASYADAVFFFLYRYEVRDAIGRSLGEQVRRDWADAQPAITIGDGLRLVGDPLSPAIMLTLPVKSRTRVR